MSNNRTAMPGASDHSNSRANGGLDKSGRARRRKGRASSRNSINSNQFYNKSVASLEATLRELGCYDDAGEPKRIEALNILEKVLYQWSSAVLKSSSSTENPENPWQQPRVALVTFGSYRLGVHRPSSDLDVLALSPPHCTRSDFFSSLVDLLKGDGRITDVHPIPSAYTPVIKFVLNGIQMDLLFARLQNPAKLLAYQQKRPSPLSETNVAAAESSSAASKKTTPLPATTRLEYSIDDSDLVGLDEASVRSVNGARVSQRLLELVPNVEYFRLNLRAVKAWAELHGVQSNVLGFLGGINWAILSAWVCIHHPQAEPARLLLLFFKTFANWKWPAPVLLGPLCTEPPQGVMHMPAWNPDVNPRDGLHLMPIITPAYPSMNSSYNVGMAQCRRITDEFYRAAYLLEESHCDWTQVLRDGGFFRRHSNFLKIAIKAQPADGFLEWKRLCESKLRLLISNLETQEVNAWPFAKFFDRRQGSNEKDEENEKTESDSMQESCFFIALRFANGVESVNLRYSTSEFLHKVSTWECRRTGMDISIARVGADDLPDFCFGSRNHNEGANKKKTAINAAVCSQGIEGNSNIPHSPTKRAKVN